MSDHRKPLLRRTVGEVDLEQVFRLVEGGDTFKGAAQKVGVRYGTLQMRVVRNRELRARLDRAVEARGGAPKRRRGACDMSAFRAALEAGATLADACNCAEVSIEAMRLRRLRDPELDRFVSKYLHHRSFDTAAKAMVVAGVRRGEQIRELLAIAGGFNYSTFRDHLTKDAAFRESVRDALGGYDDPLQCVRPTRAKAYFASVLELLPSCNTLVEALEIYGVSKTQFYSLLHYSPPRRQAFQALVAALPREGRGKRALRPSRRGCLLDASDVQAAVLEAVSIGVPLYALSTRGLPSCTTCVVYGNQNPEFKARLAEALLDGHQARRGDPRGRIAAAIEALGKGVRPSNLSSSGFASARSILSARRSDPLLDEKYHDARRKAAGLPSAEEHHSVDELVEIVGKRLPAGLTTDDVAACLSDAWIDASDGTLNTANLPSKVRQYIAANRVTEHYSRVEVGRNGDLVFADRS